MDHDGTTIKWILDTLHIRHKTDHEQDLYQLQGLPLERCILYCTPSELVLTGLLSGVFPEHTLSSLARKLNSFNATTDSHVHYGINYEDKTVNVRATFSCPHLVCKEALLVSLSHAVNDIFHKQQSEFKCIREYQRDHARSESFSTSIRILP